ncbi:MAG TPA: DNA primase [Firmicutes bacterium]|nr:DNA primase [Bacillota bacterium]HOQ23746.1 DNA primase [Bacillota bacterium]HPT66890.1 DNA primase [Bacillota bacterium]
MDKNREQLIVAIREKNDIASVVAEYVTLKKSGKTLSGLCPFHHEKTPSFTVSPDKQLFYCFGCGAGGDVFTFVMRMENLTFPQAARWLAERAQIPWVEEEESPDMARRRQERDAIFRLHKLAADFYNQILLHSPQAQAARDYLQERGLDQEAVSRFNLGYALPVWDGLVRLLKKKEIPMALAERAGLVLAGTNGYFDRFRDRIMFPILDPQGRVAAFGGRVLGDGHPKYLNSPDTPVFSKGRYLYGLFQAKEAIRAKKEAVIVEGYTDVIQAHLNGFPEVVASLGTALTMEQIKTLRRYVQQVVIAYDADAAGQAAMVRGLDLVRRAGIGVRVATLPTGDDPDSLLRRGEVERFRACIEQGEDLFLFKLNHALKSHNLNTPEGKARAVAAAIPLLAEVESRVAREEYLRLLSHRLQVTAETLYQEWRSYQRRSRKNNQTLDNSRQTGNTTVLPSPMSFPAGRDNPPDPVERLERELLRGALQEIQNFRRIIEALFMEDLENPLYREILGRLNQLYTPDREWPPEATELPDSCRTEYLSLLAENEAKQYPVDIEGCCLRLRQMQIIREIKQVQSELAAATELKGEALTERLNRLNDLNKVLRRDFPTFSGLT